MKNMVCNVLQKFKQLFIVKKQEVQVRLAVTRFKHYADEIMENAIKHQDTIDNLTFLEFIWQHEQISQLYNSGISDSELLIELVEMFGSCELKKSDSPSLAGYGFRMALETVLEDYQCL